MGRFDIVKIKFEKNKPEILMAGGLITFLGTIFLASKATLKADKILRYHKEKMKDIDDAFEVSKENEDYDYDEDTYHNDKRIEKVKAVTGLVVQFVPAVAMGSLSIGLILASRNVLNNRYLALSTAYNGLLATFTEYRKRVTDEQGEAMDRHFYYGTDLKTEQITEIGEDGKKHKKDVTTETYDFSKMPPIDSVYFDSSNRYYTEGSSAYNLAFLRGKQNHFTDLLRERETESMRGWVTINEVREALGFDPVPHGGFVGWVTGIGDGEVSFGLGDSTDADVRRFINGFQDSILLTFNHDGVIWNRLYK